MSFTKSFSSFLISGSLAFGVNLILTYFLTEFFGLWYLFSVIIGTLISWTVMFFLNTEYAFKDHKLGNLRGAYIKNVFLYVVLTPIGWGLIYWLTSILGIYYLLSQIVVVGGMSVVSFFLTRRFIFKIN